MLYDSMRLMLPNVCLNVFCMNFSKNVYKYYLTKLHMTSTLCISLKYVFIVVHIDPRTTSYYNLIVNYIYNQIYHY